MYRGWIIPLGYIGMKNPNYRSHKFDTSLREKDITHAASNCLKNKSHTARNCLPSQRNNKKKLKYVQKLPSRGSTRSNPKLPEMKKWGSKWNFGGHFFSQSENKPFSSEWIVSGELWSFASYTTHHPQGSPTHQLKFISINRTPHLPKLKARGILSLSLSLSFFFPLRHSRHKARVE